ncbi:MAG: glycosyltransferase [Rhodospirillales bacterium]|nr:glycosyltransferase [Rhodospirillales bacterium]
MKIELSIVIPLYNEEANIDELYDRSIDALDQLGKSFEIICVNDGSRDSTEEHLAKLASKDKRIKVINFQVNKGQTAAMMAGIIQSKGDIIIPMDGDLQNDPKDIEHLLKKLDEGYDVVSGWRKVRIDAVILRKIPSQIANWIISRISGVHLHDFGCTLKAYRREVLQDVRLYGEMHRFVPIFAKWQGAKVAEIPVNHFARTNGVSNYGIERVLKVILDLIVVKFLTQYETKPIYVFGLFGLFNLFISFLAGLFAVYLRVFEGISFILTPLPLLVITIFMLGIMCIFLGLLAEILVRIYFESQDKSVYNIRSTINCVDDE